MNPDSQRPLDSWKLLVYGLYRISWRRWKKNLFRVLITILIQGVGGGAFFSIRLANKAALLGFEWFSDSISGESPLIIFPTGGRLPVSVLTELRSRTRGLPVHFLPVLESTAIDREALSPDEDLFKASQFQIVGMDLMSLANLVYLKPANQWKSPVPVPDEFESPASRLPSDGEMVSGEVYISSKLARSRSWDRGQVLQVTINDSNHSLRVAGILPETEFMPSPPENLLLMDLPDLQTILNEFEFIDRIELQFPVSENSGSSLELIRKARIALTPSGSDTWQILDQSSKKNSASQMTEGFRLNLSILSLLALIVGVYLIFQSLEASIAHRRTEAAVMKSLGWRGRDIGRLWLCESIILGLAGSVCGLVIGWMGAQLAVGGIAQTVNSLYYSNTVAAAAFDKMEAVLAFSIGCIASVFAAWFPSTQVASTPPAHQLGRASSTGALVEIKPLIGYGILLVGTGWLLSILPAWTSGNGRQIPVAGYGAALCWLVGAGIISTTLFPWFSRVWQKLNPSSVVMLLASTALKRPTLHHFWANAGLVCAVGMAAGMGILIASFESTIVRWMNQILVADVYVASSGISNASSRNRIPDNTWEKIATLPNVEFVDVGRLMKITYREKQTWVIGAPKTILNASGPTIWIDQPSLSELQTMQEAGEFFDDSAAIPAIATETFLAMHRLKGERNLEIPTPTGPLPIRIVGVYADFGSELGTIALPPALMEKKFPASGILNMSIKLADSSQAAAFAENVQSMYPNLVVRLNGNIREEALKIFHQTFTVTYALQVIALIVAIAGLGLALTSLWVERIPQIQTWKELGFTPAMAGRIAMVEASILTLIATVSGLVLAMALGWLLIYVINRQSFGWTLQFHVPWEQIPILIIVSILSSLMVSWGIGQWGFRYRGSNQYE